MKTRQKKNQSFFHRSFTLFLSIILVPTLLLWTLFLIFLNIHYALRSLKTQQISLEHYGEQMDGAITAINEGILNMLESNSELSYYLKQFYDKPDMVYTQMKSILPLYETIRSSYPDVTDLHIYTDSDVLLLKPFADLSSIPLDHASMEALSASGFREILWKIDDSTPSPTCFAYQKIYNPSYSECLGYLEVAFDQQFFPNHLDAIRRMLPDTDIRFVCTFQDREIVSSDDVPSSLVSSLADSKDGLAIRPLSNVYGHIIPLQSCGITLYCISPLSAQLFQISDRVPILMISLILLLLLLCYSLFFRITRRISGKLFAFSSFLDKNSDDSLKPYPHSAPEEFAEIETLIGNYNVMVDKNHRMIRQIKEMETLTQEARYQALQSQIHPHFIYGTLETIRMLALANQDMDAASMIYSLSSLMRHSVEISSAPSCLKKELSIVRDYLDIQQIRFSGRLHASLHTDPALEDLSLPAFTLQPIVENAIVHGISNTLDPCEIRIEAARPTPKTIRITVGNTGRPIAQNRLAEINRLLSGPLPSKPIRSEQNGVALPNILKRLQFLYPNRVTMKLHVENGCTQTIITIQA